MARKPRKATKKATTTRTNESIRKFRTQFDPTYKGSKGEINSQPSKTQPDQSLTVKQLLYNHSRNLSSGVTMQKDAQYFDVEIPHFDDITERKAFLEELRQEEIELVTKAKEEIEESRKKRVENLKKKKDKQYQDFKKRQENEQKPPLDKE